MATTTDYLTQLQTDKQTLVDNLVAKGVEATNDETFTTLVPKVADIETGGGIDWGEYFTSQLPSGGYANKIYPNVETSGINGAIIKIPDNFTSFGLPTQDAYYTQMGYAMFRGCYNLKDCSALLNMNTNYLTGMDSMFNTCSSLESLPLFDTSNVKSMVSTFLRCSSLKSIPQFDTSKVTNMSSMFSSCSSLTTIPQFDTGNVTNMSYMFNGCSSLTTIPQLNANKVANLYYTFNDCKNITQLGGFMNLGEAYKTTQSVNYAYYKLDLLPCTKLTEQSLINVLTNLYDIKTKGCAAQQVILGSTNLAKLTSEEGQAALTSATEKGWTVS